MPPHLPLTALFPPLFQSQKPTFVQASAKLHIATLPRHKYRLLLWCHGFSADKTLRYHPHHSAAIYHVATFSLA